MFKQEIIVLHTWPKLRWNWANDEIINLIILKYLYNSFNFLNVNHYIIVGLVDLTEFGSFHCYASR